MSRSFVRPHGRSVSRLIFCGSLLTFSLAVSLIPLCGKNLFARGQREFVDLSGSQAQEQLTSELPPEIDPADVRSISVKRAATADSRSVWYRVKVSPTVAATWEEAVHQQTAQAFMPPSDRFLFGCSAASFVFSGPPPLHGEADTAPDWWSPPTIDFRMTEAMGWFDDSEAGAGTVMYSGYDPETGLLWVYEHSSEHELLLRRGHAVSGELLLTRPPTSSAP